MNYLKATIIKTIITIMEIKAETIARVLITTETIIIAETKIAARTQEAAIIATEIIAMAIIAAAMDGTSK